MKTRFCIPIFIPHLGCAHDCVFCNQRSVTNVQAAPSAESVAFSIGQFLEKNPQKRAEVAFFGGSFTGISREAQVSYLSAASPFLKSGRVESIRISTRPDLIDAETVDFLTSYGVKTIELGAQSMSDAVLSASGRGHTSEDTCRAAALIRRGGATLGLQMMTGLPASTPETELLTARRFVEMGADIARIYPTVVFSASPLCRMLEEGRYTPPSMEDTIARAAACLSVLEDGGVQVIRIGLQETDTLFSTVKGGAYHPAMGQLVRARVWRNRLERAVSRLRGPEITIFCEEKLTSLVVGQKKENFIYLSEKYGVRLRLVRAEKGCAAYAAGETAPV